MCMRVFACVANLIALNDSDGFVCCLVDTYKYLYNHKKKQHKKLKFVLYLTLASNTIVLIIILIHIPSLIIILRY